MTYQKLTSLKKLKNKRTLAIDTETTGFDWYSDEITISSFSDGENAYAIKTEDMLIDNKNVAHMADILTNIRLIKIFHNLKYDYNMFKYSAGIVMNDFIDERGNVVVHDTMIMAHLLNENTRNKLKTLSVDYIDKDANAWEVKLKDYVKENKIKVKETGYSEIPDSILIPYACSDAYYTYKLYEYIRPIIMEQMLWDVYMNEIKLLNTVMRMEEYGVLIDREKIIKEIPKLNSKLTKLECKIFKLTPNRFNINSTDQLAEMLFDKLNYVRVKDDSTDEEVLESYNTELTKLIIEYRHYMKLRSTYYEGILNKLDDDNILHCRFNQLGTRTGRFSSSEPNLQNIPRTGGIRELFICRPGTKIYYLDYSQIEMCIFAHYAKEGKMIRYIREGKSLHKTLASDLFKIPYDRVKKESEEYRIAKEINFGIIYGMGKVTLAKKIHRSVSEASRFLNRIYMIYPRIKILRRQVMGVIKARGYVKNFYRRRRRLEPDDAYKGINALVQGATGDMLKFKMNEIKKYIIDNKLKSELLLTIHDELVIEVPNNEDKHVKEFRKIFIDFKELNLTVPISCEIEYTSTNWSEKKPWRPTSI